MKAIDGKKLIRELRCAGMTQAEIGIAVGLKQNSISDIDRGRTKSVTYDVGKRLVDLHRRKVRKSA